MKRQNKEKACLRKGRPTKCRDREEKRGEEKRREERRREATSLTKGKIELRKDSTEASSVREE